MINIFIYLFKSKKFLIEILILTNYKKDKNICQDMSYTYNLY